MKHVIIITCEKTCQEAYADIQLGGEVFGTFDLEEAYVLPDAESAMKFCTKLAEQRDHSNVTYSCQAVEYAAPILH